MFEENMLVAEQQGGFGKGRGCRDQLVTLVLLGQIKVVTGRRMFACISLFKKAYDGLE